MNITTNIGIDGKELSADSKEKILAKSVYSEEAKTYTYYVLCSGGTLYNPYTAGLFYDRPHMRWKLLKVSDSIYELYLGFLKSRRGATLRQAERLI